MDDATSESTGDYLKSWNQLATMIQRGRSFSGRERNCCFLNTASERFADVSAATGLDSIDDGRAMAVADWDHDGDLDLWFSNRTGPRIRFMRNDLDESNHYVSFRLEGTNCNRDAIGARVQLYVSEKATESFIKTLRAGEGFVSQSSKWIYFGLGHHTALDRVEVRWPGDNNPESFPIREVDRRFLLKQGTARAVPVANRDVHVGGSSAAKARLSTDQARIVLTHRRDMPEIIYRDFKFADRDITIAKNGPALINLWAPWCAPCLQELSQFADRRNEIEKAGLNIVALAVGTVGTDQNPPNPLAARQFIDQLVFPFGAGTASPRQLRVFTELVHGVVYRKRPLPLPCSFLIDGHGKLAIIYKGTVSANQVLNDLALLDASASELATAAAPFPGVNVIHHFDPSILSIARAYIEGGYWRDAKAELTRYLQKRASNTNSTASNGNSRLARAYRLLAKIAERQRRPDERIAALKHLVELQPDDVSARIALAVANWESGRQGIAKNQLNTLERNNSNKTDALIRIAQVYTAVGDYENAMRLFKTALAQAPEDPEIRMSLAMAYQIQSVPDKAIEQYRWILRRYPRALEAANNLAWLHATHPEDRIRDGERAKDLGETICRATDFRKAEYLDTYAAALAESGDFSRAAELAKKAIELAEGRSQNEMANKVRSRLEQYRSSRPYRVAR